MSTSTLTASPPPSLSVPATLPAAARIQYLNELFRTNGNCKLPCLIGITPGETNLQSALMIMGPAGWQGDDPEGFLEFGDGQPNLDFGISTESADTIQSFYLHTSDTLTQYPTWAKLFRGYWVDHILANLGVPSQVWLSLVLGPHSYNIYVIYDKPGVLIAYSAEGMVVENEAYRVCPSFAEVDGIGLYVQAPTVTQSIVDMANGIVGIRQLQDDGFMRTWNEATGLDLSDFQASFPLNSPAKCFQSPESAWRP